MAEISDSLRLLFEASIEADDDRYVISVPKGLIENGSLSVTESYRVALLAVTNIPTNTKPEPPRDVPDPDRTQSESSETTSQPQEPRSQGPPVDEGEIRSVAIDTLGDQGDGIARVERGFIVIVPGTQPGDQVDVKITDVKENVAFAETVGEADVR